MPSLPNVPQVLRHDMEFHVGTDLTNACRFFMSYSGQAPSSATLSTYTNALAAVMGTQFAPLMIAANTFNALVVTDLTSPSAATASHAVGTAGTRAGGELSAGTCALLNWSINRRYRGGKPRMYLPFGSATDLTNPQTWTGAFTSAVHAAITAVTNSAVANPPAGSSITNVVSVSYYSGFASYQNPVTKRWHNVNTPRTTPLQDVVTGSSVNAIPASQRRRLRSG